eukprot:UN28440
MKICHNAQFCILFSSTSSLFGFGGQSVYAGANTYLDWYSQLQDHNAKMYSIQWSGWKDIGMSVDTDLKELSGEKHIDPKTGYNALKTILTSNLETGVYSVLNIINWNDFSNNEN